MTGPTYRIPPERPLDGGWPTPEDAEEDPVRCTPCGVTVEWKPWPETKPRPAWLGDRAGYWLDGFGGRGAYEYGKPSFDTYWHDHTP